MNKLNKTEFGDFQTPLDLALKICTQLRRRGVNPTAILEPTCGKGSFLLAAADVFAHAGSMIGVEINNDYLTSAQTSLNEVIENRQAHFINEDFFSVDWANLLSELADPLLVIGNPPWVTNSKVSALNGSNTPKKSNFQNHRGIDALTGKSNFDISEWMLIQLFQLLEKRSATIAMLCKTSVARKVLHHAWKHGINMSTCNLYSIDAVRHFGAAVDACLLVVDFSDRESISSCFVHSDLDSAQSLVKFGFHDGQMIADLDAYNRRKHLIGKVATWRSGIKHDCSKIMEFRKEGEFFRNGSGELVELELDFMYPMLKSSDLSNGLPKPSNRWMLVPQASPKSDTSLIEQLAPMTWQYLVNHSAELDIRRSSIYEKRSRFAVFGVGDYSFTPWKVAISGMYKTLSFSAIGPLHGRPVVFDDTCYFLSCRTEEEAVFKAELLNSEAAHEFYSAFVFWDNKRPINADVLGKLNLVSLAKEQGRLYEAQEALF